MVIQLIEAGAYVSLDEPVHRCPFPSKFSQGRVATAVGSKSMAGVLEVGSVWAVVDGFKYHMHDFLDHLIPYARDAEFS